jgi:UDP-2,3-diacylglucosamine pyrophosphatase LpxH
MLQLLYALLTLASALYTLLLLAYVLHNFPWLLDREKLVVHQVMLRKSDQPMLIVSDLHFGSRSAYRYFLAILRAVKPRTLVIAGDLVDERMLMSERMLRLLKTLTICAKNVFYTPSSSNHDHAPKPTFISLEENEKRVAIASPILKLCVEECSNCLYITHGDYASRSGVIAHFLEEFVQRLFLKPFIGGVLRKKLGISDGSWVVYGHSHKAWSSHAWRTVNTGCWINRIYESMQMALAVAACRNSIVSVKLLKLS